MFSERCHCRLPLRTSLSEETGARFSPAFNKRELRDAVYTVHVGLPGNLIAPGAECRTPAGSGPAPAGDSAPATRASSRAERGEHTATRRRWGSGSFGAKNIVH